ncbi:MAG TPA: plastocyanin/azurin family copper-binding protein [Acidimicrobiales bacterium]
MTPRTRTLAAALAVVSLLALGACGGGGKDGAAEGSDASGTASGEDAPFEVDGEPVATDKVTLPRSYTFEPAVITVKPGTTVTWENKDDFPHNVKLMDDGEVQDLRVGATTTITFDEEGTFYYQCTLHPTQMKGKVVVEP